VPSHFIEVQQQFMAHIRDPAHNAKPADVEERRMAIYRDLFFNNVDGFVSSAFPVLKSLYKEDDWQQRVRQFFSKHDCSSPFFLDIAGEFLQFLAGSYTKQKNDPPFMLELAHYEWVELDVSVSHQGSHEINLEANQVARAGLYLTSLARNLSYLYPVHTISQDHQPTVPASEPYYFVVYRDNNDEVQFLSTNAMTALLLSIIESQPGIDLAEVCQQVAKHAPQFTLEQLYQGALSTLSSMAERGVIVTQRAP
jgi:hypothetical protein|tara:strand:+ start:1147 stop:1905 length:759 start_codon:yes stop_codon:yes gene_type:complete